MLLVLNLQSTSDDRRQSKQKTVISCKERVLRAINHFISFNTAAGATKEN